MLGNVGEVGDGEADGVGKFGSEEHAKRVQEEFAPITRFFVEKASQFLRWVRSTAGSLCSTWHRRKVTCCHHSGRRRLRAHAQVLRELAERIMFCNTIVPFCDNDTIDIKARRQRRRECFESESMAGRKRYVEIWDQFLEFFSGASLATTESHRPSRAHQSIMLSRDGSRSDAGTNL